MKLAAAEVSAFAELGTQFVVFRESASQGVVVSKNLSTEDRDRALGLDGIYVERNDQSQGGYDLVEEVIVENGSVVLSLREHNPLRCERLEISFVEDAQSAEGLATLYSICREARVPFTWSRQ